MVKYIKIISRDKLATKNKKSYLGSTQIYLTCKDFEYLSSFLWRRAVKFLYATFLFIVLMERNQNSKSTPRVSRGSFIPEHLLSMPLGGEPFTCLLSGLWSSPFILERWTWKANLAEQSKIHLVPKTKVEESYGSKRWKKESWQHVTNHCSCMPKDIWFLTSYAKCKIMNWKFILSMGRNILFQDILIVSKVENHPCLHR